MSSINVFNEARTYTQNITNIRKKTIIIHGHVMRRERRRHIVTWKMCEMGEKDNERRFSEVKHYYRKNKA